MLVTLKQNKTRGRSAQGSPCPCAQVRSKKNPEFDLAFCQNFPWEALSEHLTKTMDVRTNWVGLVKLRNQGFHMVWVSHSWAQNSLPCDAPKIGICVFGPFSEIYHAESLRGTENRPLLPHDTLQIRIIRLVLWRTRMHGVKLCISCKLAWLKMWVDRTKPKKCATVQFLQQ